MHYTPPMARNYVRRIRNAAKRRYAGEYLDYLKGVGPEPMAQCSAMAAQAVRMNLDDIMAQCHSTSQGAKAMQIHNNMCDGSHCKSEHGEVRVYPLGGGGNLILCHACWAYENRYSFERGRETKQPDNWPQKNWYDAKVYESA